MLEVISCVDSLDELTSLGIYNSVWPHDAVTIDAVHSFRDSAEDYVDYLVRDEGVILGSGVGAIFGYRTDRVTSLITVSVTHRKRGAGTALYEALSAWANERGARKLEVAVADSDAESLSFAQHRDFTEERREVRLVLKLAGISPRRSDFRPGSRSSLGRSDRNSHAGCTRWISKLGQISMASRMSPPNLSRIGWRI
jgi:GNAT superfamily N-acetyltransferase